MKLGRMQIGIGAPSIVAPSYPLWSNLYAGWHMDEASNQTRQDIFGTYNLLDYSNSCPAVAGQHGNAVETIASTPHLYIAQAISVLSSSGWTMAMWTQRRADVISCLVSGSAYPTPAFYLETGRTTIGDLRLCSNYWSSDWAITSGLVLPLNTWKHVIVVFDGSQPSASRFSLYIDGQPVALTVSGTIPTTLGAGSGRFSVGRVAGAGAGYSGYTDELYIWSDTKSQNWASNFYSQNKVYPNI